VDEGKPLAIGGKRFSEGTSADREIQRTLMELLNQLDGTATSTTSTTSTPTTSTSLSAYLLNLSVCSYCTDVPVHTCRILAASSLARPPVP
jgi:hypothetical protein